MKAVAMCRITRGCAMGLSARNIEDCASVDEVSRAILDTSSRPLLSLSSDRIELRTSLRSDLEAARVKSEEQEDREDFQYG